MRSKPTIDREGELVQRDKKAAEPGEQIDREQQPEMRVRTASAKVQPRRGAAAGALDPASDAVPSALAGGARSARRNTAASGSKIAAINAACTR